MVFEISSNNFLLKYIYYYLSPTNHIANYLLLLIYGNIFLLKQIKQVYFPVKDAKYAEKCSSIFRSSFHLRYRKYIQFGISCLKCYYINSWQWRPNFDRFDYKHYSCYEDCRRNTANSRLRIHETSKIGVNNLY